MQKSPFKFLDSYTKEDRDIFFGRDKEIEELHSRVFESKILLIYGTSGTGKSSLINCGLANRFNDSDWLPVNIRRGADINRSLFEALYRSALTKAPFEKANLSAGYNLERLLRSVYLDHFKPVFLIFDQFEELFIFGGKDEKNELIRNVAKAVDSDIQCRFIFSLREEYLAGVTEFERIIPSFLSNRIRIEKMTRQNAIQTITGPCRINNIDVEKGFAEAILEKLNPDTPEVELTWLQIYLDKIMRLAEGEDHTVKKITTGLLEKAGDVKDILGSFLEEQISQLSDPDTGLVVLKSFVSVKGTKHQITESEVIEYSVTFGKKIDPEIVKGLIQRFIRLRILRDKDEEGRYELRHDSLATKIFEKITLVEKELLEVKYFIENAYANYEKRHLFLTEEDLKYIAPYEDKLFLNERNQKFLAHSKLAIQKARKRRQNIVVTIAAIIFVILSFFTVWAMRERGNAITQRQIAEDQKNAAVAAKEMADSARHEAVESRQKAEENERIAVSAKNQSETARKEALAARENALQQKSIAEQMSAVATEQANKAEEERKAADKQRILAQAAEEKARRLSLLMTAQNLALKSLSMEKNPELMGLLAVQAYNFNISNGGEIDDPVIFKALTKSFILLDNNKHTLFTGTPNEIRSLAENKSGLLSADLDGNILQWDYSGNKKEISAPTESSFIYLISLSPGGDKTLTAFENGKLLVKTLSDNVSGTSELLGHTGHIRTATWDNDGNRLATAGSDSLLIIWDVFTYPAKTRMIFESDNPVKSLAFAGGDTLFSAHIDGSVYMWKTGIHEGELIYTSETNMPVSLAWNKIKNTLVAGCSDGMLLIFNLNQLPCTPESFIAHTAGIDNLIFNHDFSLMATASWDRGVRLHNYHNFFEHSNIVGGSVSFEDMGVRCRAMIFTEDNRLAASMSDKTIRVWDTSPARLVSMICRLIGRDMTASEWAEGVGSEIPYEKTCGMNPQTADQ